MWQTPKSPAKKQYPFTVDPFSRVFLENESLSLEERIGLGMMEVATYTDIHIDEPIVLAHAFPLASDSAAWYLFGSGIVAVESRFDDNIRQHPEYREALEEIKEKMLPYSTQNKINAAMSEEEHAFTDQFFGWGGGWGGHGNPDYGPIIHMGTDGMRKKIAEACKHNPQKESFYQGCLYALGAIDVLGARFAALAKKRLDQCKDPEMRKKYEKMVEAFAVIPTKPAYDFHSAVQFFWMLFTFDGIDSPGRLDQYLADYYVRANKAEADDILDRLWDAFHNTRTWNLTIGGSDAQWHDQSNPLTYAILEVTTRKVYHTPNLTLRVHRNTPQKIWEMASHCLSTGCGLPAIYNDEVVCPALEKICISPDDAHEYCLNGCNQIDIMGKSHMGLEDGEVNFLKCLEWVLREEQAARYPSWEELKNAFIDTLHRACDMVCEMANRSQKIYGTEAPNPLRSLYFEDCINTGTDYKCGGPRYGHGQILAEGIADTADSLWAVKHLVFDTHQYTMAQIRRALLEDFAGQETLLEDCKSCDKFGNDLDTVDHIAVEIVDDYMRYLHTKPTWRGGIYTGGCSPYDRAAQNGAAVGAMPNGRRAADSILADSIGAVPGNDREGPTALLNSCMKYHQTLAGSGFILNLKFDKTLFGTQTGQKAFIDLVKTYFANGGQMVTATVVSRAELLDAKIHPQRHADLIVRVGGYSDYFINLTPELQDNVIARTDMMAT